MKGFVTVFFVISSLLFFSGCPDSDETEGFSWRRFEKENLEIYLSQHPYSESIIKKIPEFERETGINVHYHIETESTYYQNLRSRIKSSRNKPDIFMAGAYQLWDFQAKGYVDPLDSYIDNPLLTGEDYDFEDFFPTIIHSLRWDRDSLLAVPLGFEIYSLAYNKRIFEEFGLKPPETLEELCELCDELKGFNGPDTFAVSLRGTEDWATIHTAYMTLYSHFGASDIEFSDGKWTSLVNSGESLAMNRFWVELVRKGGPPDWRIYDWYKAGAALGDERAAMLFDADIVGFFQNTPGASREAGNIAWVPPPVLESKVDKPRGSNMWIWSLAMNSRSKNREAAWLFMQYFTNPSYQRWSAVTGKNVNPPRQSVFENPDFQLLLSQADGYGETLARMIDNSSILFTPNEHNMEFDLIWSRTIRKIVLDEEADIKSELDLLKKEIDIILQE